MEDEIVEEIRRYRDAHAQKFNYDIDAICEDFMASQFHSGHPVVRFEPKKLASKAKEQTDKRKSST
ncbi:MAG: hypothetical protein AB1656_00760 [Candidatus Omnitrophota bacterium]